MHRLPSKPRGRTTIAFDPIRRTFLVRSSDPEMFELLKAIAERAISPVLEEGGSIAFSAPETAPLTMDDFDPSLRDRLEFGMTVLPSEFGAINNREPSRTQEVVMEMSRMGTLDTKKGD